MIETTIAHSVEPVETGSKSAFSYCCECGTYDLHKSVCTCCGFDFSGAVAADDGE